MINLLANFIYKKITNAIARLIAGRIKEVKKFIQIEIAKSQAAQAAIANRHKKKPPTYKVRDKV